jgi:hypothetical protein
MFSNKKWIISHIKSGKLVVTGTVSWKRPIQPTNFGKLGLWAPVSGSE